MVGVEVLLLALAFIPAILMVGGALSWLLTVLTGGGFPGYMGLGAAIVGEKLSEIHAIVWPISLAVLALAIWQHIRFQTPYSLAAALLALTHLGLKLYEVWRAI